MHAGFCVFLPYFWCFLTILIVSSYLVAAGTRNSGIFTVRKCPTKSYLGSTSVPNDLNIHRYNFAYLNQQFYAAFMEMSADIL